MRKFSGRQFVRWSSVPYLLVVGISLFAYFDDRVGWRIYILMILPIAVLVSMLQDKHASQALPDLVEDPLIGKEVVVIENFRNIDGGFEGRVLVNGAPWPARSTVACLVEGDTSVVAARTGSLLELEEAGASKEQLPAGNPD